jgi:hypothetical protein
MKERFIGEWRSYKVFYFSGKVEKHNDDAFIEITIDEQDNFKLVDSKNPRNNMVYPTDQWNVAMLQRRGFIYLGKRQAYEIITLEQEDMVLQEVVRGEKLFFAKMPGWNRRIEPVITSIRHIHPGTETEERK